MTNKPGHILGQRLREARTERGFSQENVAEMLGAARTSVTNYERRTVPSIKTLLILCEIFNKTPNYFLGFTERGENEN